MCGRDVVYQKGKGEIMLSILKQPEGVGFGLEVESFVLTVKVRPSN